MTVEPTTPRSGELTTDQAKRNSTRRFLPGRRACGATAAVLLSAAAAATLTLPGTASAMTTPLSAPVTSECYSNGHVVADRPSVNSNGQYVAFTPVLYVWSNGQWAYDGMGPVQIGQEPGPGAAEIGTWILIVNSVTFSAQPGHYYEVVDEITTSAGVLQYLAQPMRDRVGSNYYCYTS